MGGASATSQTTPRMEIQGPEDLSAIPHNNAILRTLALVENKALLLQQAQQFYLLPLKALQTQQIRLSLQQDHIEQQPLLIPILFRLDETQQKAWQQQRHFSSKRASLSTKISLSTVSASPLCQVVCVSKIYNNA